MKNCGIYQKVMIAVNCLADYSRHLIQDVFSNIVEHYNSAIAMFTGGKRTNLVQRDSHRTRCAAASCSAKQADLSTDFQIHKSFHKYITKSSPGDYAELVSPNRKADNELERRNERKPLRPGDHLI